MIRPLPLRKGDKIAIISPASAVKEEYVAGCADFLQRKGFETEIMPSASGKYISGSFAAPYEQRLSDLKQALTDNSVKAILCARGGYGCVHLLPAISLEEVHDNPKWIVGFSDISALLALWYRAGVMSIHGPMAKHLSTMPSDDPSTEALLYLLEGSEMQYVFPANELERQGLATGRLVGGNLAVLNGLSATPFDMLNIAEDDNVILFLEDISEPIYAVERMLMRLFLSGSLNRVKGLIFGGFTEYKADRNHSSMEEMADKLFKRLNIQNIPVAFNFPVGHTDENFPLVIGNEVKLIVGSDKVSLSSINLS